MKRMKTRATNNNNESSKGPSNGDVFSVLDTAMEWYEQQSECCPIQLLLLKRIRDLVQGKNEDSCDENEMNFVAHVTTSSEMRNITKSMRNY
ncbi:uncharacterized protein TNCV_635311 [Trichonephila clavipes]|nr:uncharacterized protein TNCV_635311 [Trichonephila clavipes]